MLANLSPAEQEQARQMAADMLAGMGIPMDGMPETDTPILGDDTIVDDVPPGEDIAPKDLPAERKRGRSPGGKDAKLLAGLQGIYYLVGTVLMFVNAKDANIVIAAAPDRALELLAVANHHPQFKMWLERFTQSNDYLSLVLGHGLMAMAILANHNMISPQVARALPAIEAAMKQVKP